MPHDDHELALLHLRIAEYTAGREQSGGKLLRMGDTYRLLRKTNPSVESVLRAIQKHVINLSFSVSGAGSGAGFS